MSLRRGGERGQVLVAVILLFVILSILAPLMVFYAQKESQWTVKQAQSTTAFHLAEAGIEKGYLAIAQSTSVWSNIQNGQTLTHYHFDMAYTDEPGGTYTISITSGPSASEVTIISVGRDALKRELRGIKAEYSEAAVSAALQSDGITASGGVSINWGPMFSLGNITLSGSANVCYPQKYAVGSISTSGSSPQGCHNTWTSPTTPCTDNKEWWAYNCPPGVPPAPTFDLATYKTKAQADHCPTSGGSHNFPSGASPAGSCYWPTSAGDQSFSNIVMTSSATLYIEQNLTVSNGFLWGSAIVGGNISFSGGGRANSYTIPDWFTPDGIPSTAWKQYQDLDTVATAEYYGDAGYQTVNNSFTFCLNGHPSIQSGTTDCPAMRGLLYIGGTFSASGSTAFHGVIYSPNGFSSGSGGVAIYYDADVANGVILAASVPTRVLWQDVTYASWPGP